MSASRDKSQKVAFVYSNLYQMFKKGEAEAKVEAKVEAQAAEPAVNPGLTTAIETPVARSSGILKAGDLHSNSFAAIRVNQYNPTEFIAKRVARPASLPPRDNAAVDSLKKNLDQLNDLHSRLRFMLQELEDLVKE